MNSQSSLNLRDPRSKVSSSHSAKMSNELFNFLKQIGHERSRQTSLISLKNVGQIATDLFRQIQPKYNFERRIEDEFVRLFRTLQYPYQITKNDMYQLQNNRSSGMMLSALHWLMELVKYALTFNPEEFTIEKGNNNVNANHDKLKWELLYCLIQTKNNVEKQMDIVNNFNEQLREQEMEGVDEENLSNFQHTLEKLEAEDKDLKEKSVIFAAHIEKLANDIALMDGNIEKVDEFLENMFNYNANIVDEIQEAMEAIRQQEENSKLLNEDISNAKEIVRSQPFSVEEYSNMKEKMNQNKLKIADYENQLNRMSSKYDEIKNDINSLRVVLQESCDEIRNQCNEIQSYPYLKGFLRENAMPIGPIGSTHLSDTSQLVTDESIYSFLEDNNIKENLKNCESIVIALWQKIEKENESLSYSIKNKNNQISQLEIEIEKYNRELAHLESQCQNMEKRTKLTNSDLTSINEHIFNLKRSKLIADQDIFQLESSFETLQEKLRTEQLKNSELIKQLDAKYDQTLEKCLKVSLSELEKLKSAERYFGAKVIDIKHFCEIDSFSNI